MTEERRGRGRPRTGETPNRTFRLSDGIMALLDELAADDGRTRTAALEEAIREAAKRKLGAERVKELIARAAEEPR